jgi:ubiquinone/menaquinone biosynthesis C-methylase UbiE
MDEKFIFNTVIKKYNNNKEIKFLEKTLNTGLKDYEEIIINKYCNTPGKGLIIGSGAGREAIKIAKKNIAVTGIDIVENLALLSYKELKKKLLNSSFATMNACQLGFKKESFDYIFMLGQLLSLIPFRKNRIEVLKECNRVLKNNGKIILTTHSRNKNISEKCRWEIINFIRKFKSLLGITSLEEGDKWVKAISGYKITDDKIYLHLYTPKEAIEDIIRAELKLVEVLSATEIVNNYECKKIRENDNYIVYIAKKT